MDIENSIQEPAVIIKKHQHKESIVEELKVAELKDFDCSSIQAKVEIESKPEMVDSCT